MTPNNKTLTILQLVLVKTGPADRPNATTDEQIIFNNSIVEVKGAGREAVKGQRLTLLAASEQLHTTAADH